MTANSYTFVVYFDDNVPVFPAGGGRGSLLIEDAMTFKRLDELIKYAQNFAGKYAWKIVPVFKPDNA